MRIERLRFLPEYSSNIYVVGNEGEPAIIIDPGSNLDSHLERYISRHHGGKIAAILLTHGHIDHIEGLRTLKTGAPIYLSVYDAKYLSDPKFNLSRELTGEDFVYENPNLRFLEGGERLSFTLPKAEFLVISTPFHTPGSLCFYNEDERALFSGDTLFHLGIGRSDLPGGRSRDIKSSLQKLSVLSEETRVYPGHGEGSVMGSERRYNPFLLGL